MTQNSPVSYWILGGLGRRVGSGWLKVKRIGSSRQRGRDRAVRTCERGASYWRVVLDLLDYAKPLHEPGGCCSRDKLAGGLLALRCCGFSRFLDLNTRLPAARSVIL